MLADRGNSPIDFNRFSKIKKHLKKGEIAQINRRHQAPPYEYHAQPIGPAPAPLPPQPNHPFARNLGIAGLGAGVGIAAYHYRKPLLKLGQKVINYAADKFHHLFNPTNETEATHQINNRAAF